MITIYSNYNNIIYTLVHHHSSVATNDDLQQIYVDSKS